MWRRYSCRAVRCLVGPGDTRSYSEDGKFARVRFAGGAGNSRFLGGWQVRAVGARWTVSIGR